MGRPIHILALCTFAGLGMMLSKNNGFAQSCGPIYMATWILWVGYLFRHWRKSAFTSSKVRRTWFWALLLGTPPVLLGPLGYYVSVVLLKRGLTSKTEK
jgi:hypothetical protein